MLEQDGFAASARSHNGSNLMARTIEIDAVEHLLFAETPPQFAYDDRRPIFHTVVGHRLISHAPSPHLSDSSN